MRMDNLYLAPKNGSHQLRITHLKYAKKRLSICSQRNNVITQSIAEKDRKEIIIKNLLQESMISNFVSISFISNSNNKIYWC